MSREDSNANSPSSGGSGQLDRKTVLASLCAAGIDAAEPVGFTDRFHITPAQVRSQLAKPLAPFSLERLATFISPAAGEMLEEMAAQAHRITLQRFGRVMQLYAPLYLSSYCCNQCTYCGFNTKHKATRCRLSVDEAVAEAEILSKQDYRDLLLVSGEDPSYISVDYLVALAERLRGTFSSISVEIYPLSREGYASLFAAGIEGVTLYQETYNRKMYEVFHPGGPKSDFENRISCQEGAAKAGMRRLGLGVLLGLYDWRLETLALGIHARSLMKNYWQSKISFSFPRIQPAEEVDLSLPHPVSDRNMVQMIMALRLTFPDAGLVLSTRESKELRDHLIPLGITMMSAGSSTEPGGYGSKSGESSKQFDISDGRASGEIADMLLKRGYEPVWKDWDSGF